MDKSFDLTQVLSRYFRFSFIEQCFLKGGRLMKNLKLKKLFAIGAMSLVLFAYQNCITSEIVEFSSHQWISEGAIPVCSELTNANFNPQLYYTWDSSSQFPLSDQIMSSPVVGDINGDGFPEVVFVSYEGSAYYGQGVLRVLNGATLGELFSVGSESLAPRGDISPLLIDIDRDGKGEIIYVHEDRINANNQKAVALNYDGSVRWEIPIRFNSCLGGLSAADLDGDGTAEILGNGEILVETKIGSNTFSVRAKPYHSGVGGCNKTQIATKFSASDSAMSIVDGSGVYSLKDDGFYEQRFSVTCSRCFVAVADIDSSYPGKEAIYTGSGVFEIYSSTGQKIASGDLVQDLDKRCNYGSGGGAATIGDFDGQPETIEFAVATGKALIVFDKNGNELVSSEIQDCSSHETGITSFDFNGDGQPEILYGDETTFRVYHMKNGSLEVLWEIENSTGTLYEYPVVVDVNGDYSPEILVVANTFFKSSARNKGLRIFSVSQERVEAEDAVRWMPTRRIWNQHNYFVSNVDDLLGATSSGFLDSEVDRNFRRNLSATNISCRSEQEEE